MELGINLECQLNFSIMFKPRNGTEEVVHTFNGLPDRFEIKDDLVIIEYMHQAAIEPQKYVMNLYNGQLEE